MLIGLCGAAGSGKSTVAKILLARHYCAPVALADPIYKAVAAITGLDEDRLKDRDFKERPIEWLGKSPRFLLQTLGTEWGRDLVSSDIWVTICRRRIEAIQKHGYGVSVADVRFVNEAVALREMGGVIWRIRRPSAEAVESHSSEAGLPDELVDEVLDNDGSVADLQRLVDGTMERYGKDAISCQSRKYGGSTVR